jgi:hypothetical protein
MSLKFLNVPAVVVALLSTTAYSNAQTSTSQGGPSAPNVTTQDPPSPDPQTTGQGKGKGPIGTQKDGQRNFPGDTRRELHSGQQQSREDVHNPKVLPDD